jgi:hypothetical protein
MRQLKVFLIIVVIVLTVSNAAQSKSWRVPKDFATIQMAIESSKVNDGDTIRVSRGSHAGALVTKSVEIVGQGNALINDGPIHSSGVIQGFRMLAGSDGAVISNLFFEVDLAIMNGGAVNNVTVDHCAFYSSIQAISNWSGSGWLINHNVIMDLKTRNGGGIGILIGDRSGGIVENNVVSHNTIFGTLNVWENDGGGYSGSGIVIYADFRYGWSGADQIKNNYVIHNDVALASDIPEVVDVVAFELTDTRDDPELAPGTIFDNAIGFNDFRGTEVQIALTPDNLIECNAISRNLGSNRGHGLHPGVFGPGGN